MKGLAHGLLTILFALWSACGGGGRDTPLIDLASLRDLGPPDATPDEGAAAPDTPLVVTEDFRIVYAYTGRTLENSGRVEFRLADPRYSDTADHALLLATSSGAIPDCSFGCFMDRGLRYLAVATVGSGKGHGLQVYDLGAPDGPSPVGPFVTDVAHMTWAESVLYYSRNVVCPTGTAAVTQCFDVFRFDPKNPEVAQRLTQMPPVEEEGLTTAFQYGGFFRVGEDGKTLIFFVPTNVSVTVWIYRDGLRRKVLGPLCAAKDPYGQCIQSPGGTSMFREHNPVALSQDGRTLVFPLLEENRELKLYRYEIGDPEARFSTLLSVPSDYLKNACYNRLPWQITEVRGPLRFSPLGDEVLFIGAHTCKPNQVKPWTNILRLDVAKIGVGAPLSEADFEKVTDNPQGYTARAIAISDFDLSPSGEYVVFSGTPTVDMEGNPLPSQPDGRHERDSEVHVTRYDGGVLPVQVTNDVMWRADQVMAVVAQ